MSNVLHTVVKSLALPVAIGLAVAGATFAYMSLREATAVEYRWLRAGVEQAPPAFVARVNQALRAGDGHLSRWRWSGFNRQLEESGTAFVVALDPNADAETERRLLVAATSERTAGTGAVHSPPAQ
jgi:hypothetical protein